MSASRRISFTHEASSWGSKKSDNAMTPTPLYNPTTANPAYQLRYVWTCWPSARTFGETPHHVLSTIATLWEDDGLRMLEASWQPDNLKIVFSTKPQVSPVFLAARAKGRLTHALRLAGLELPLSRKTAVRSLGENTIARR
jgi:hypothetical protein